MNNSKEILELWQPVTSLKGRKLYLFQFVEILRHIDYLKITLKDLNGNMVDIIYDDPENVCPLEYFVWAFRYDTEVGALHKSFPKAEPNNIDEGSIHFFKVKNSNYIKEFDNNPLANKKLYPNVEHHVFMTGDEIFEVIANYEPRFIEKKKEVR